MRKLATYHIFLASIATFIALLIAGALTLPHRRYAQTAPDGRPIIQEGGIRRKVVPTAPYRLDQLPLKFKGADKQNSADWLKEMELTFENVSDKPIYFFSINITFRSLPKIEGSDYGFHVDYGDSRFIY